MSAGTGYTESRFPFSFMPSIKPLRSWRIMVLYGRLLIYCAGYIEDLKDRCKREGIEWDDDLLAHLNRIDDQWNEKGKIIGRSQEKN
jgi:hypothetical protein